MATTNEVEKLRDSFKSLVQTNARWGELYQIKCSLLADLDTELSEAKQHINKLSSLIDEVKDMVADARLMSDWDDMRKQLEDIENTLEEY